MRGWALIFAVCWFAFAAGAQPWVGIANPPGVEISLRLLDPHPYRQGEAIRVESKAPNWQPGTPPPAEQWPFYGLLLDPEQECGSMAKPCVENVGMVNGLVRRRDTTLLNRWLPSLPPGHYRAAIVCRKLVLTSREPGSSTYGYADPPRYAVSNLVDFDIIEATPEWVHQTVTAAAAALRTTASPDAAEEAAEQLQYLDRREAWEAALAALPAQPRPLLQGLQSSRQPDEVCTLMQERIPAPRQSVSTSYLWTLQQTCVRAHLPPPPAPKAPARAAAVRIVPAPLDTPPAKPDPAMEAHFRELRNYETGLWTKATGALAASLTAKQGEAKTAAFTTLLEYVQQHRTPSPAWVPALTREFLAWWPSAAGPGNRHLLDLFANTVRSPDVVPLLESVLDQWKPGDYYEAVHSALRDLYEIDPRRAQARILAELTRSETWLDVPQLEMLPPSAVAPMDDALIGALAAAQRPPGWNPGLRMAAIAKYATDKAASRIRAIYESQQDPCQPELMAYFVRVDPSYADRVFHSHAWDMQTPPPRCTVQYFLRTPPLAMGPPLEKYLEAYLMHSNVYVKTTAAHQLGRYGSPAALPSLWHAFRYFHDYWKGKEAQLERNGESAHLEVELRNAIAYGSHWLTDQADLHTMESICLSGQCIGDTRQDLAASQEPLRIEINGPGGPWRVAQYTGYTGLSELEGRLALFPRGTRFRLAADNAGPAAVARVRDFGAARGLLIGQ